MDGLSHKGGVAWNAAKLPAVRHDCSVHSEGYIGTMFVQRCACGASRGGGRAGRWIDKNARRFSPVERAFI